MRRRLLRGTLGIALLCVLVLGVPLVALARHQVWTSAQDRVRGQADDVAVAVEDRLEVHQSLDVSSLLGRMKDRRITITDQDGRVVQRVGPALGETISGRSAVLDYTVVVEAPRAPVAAQARDVTLLVVALATGAVLAAVLLALRQGRRLGRPVAQLLARADDLGRGDFSSAPLVSGIPEIDAVAETLDRSARQIGTLVQIQGEFAADAAHQLRSPLTSVGLHLDEIAAMGDDAVRAETEEAIAQVERLGRVITSLLARARGDAVPAVTLDLGSLVAHGCSPWTRLLARDGRALRSRLQRHVLVRARADHVLTVLGSLLDNALVHGAGAVTVSVRAENQTAVLTVEDEGPGVPADVVDHLFERRVSGSRGTGIGLGLARSLVVAEGGALRLQGSSCFVVSLPRVPASPA